MVNLPLEYYVGWFVFVISRHFKASVGISTYCTQPSFPKKRKGPNKSFIEDVAVLSGSDDDKDEEGDEENKENFKDDFVVEDGAEEEEYGASMPCCCRNNDIEDLDKDNICDKSKGRKR